MNNNTARHLVLPRLGLSFLAVLLVCVPAATVANASNAFHVFLTTTGDSATRNDGLAKFNDAGTLADFYAVEPFSSPYSVVTDGTILYVTQDRTGSSFINRYAVNGQFLGTFTDLGPDFDDATLRMQRDHAGNLYVVDISQGDVVRIGPDGALDMQVAERGRGADADVAGNVYVSERETLAKYDANGALLTSLSTNFTFSGDLAIDERRDLLYLADEPGRIGVYDISGDSPDLNNVFDIAADIISLTYDPYTEHLFTTSTNGFAYEWQTDGRLVQTYASPDVRFNWGIAAVPVPEPGGIWLVLWCGLGCARRLGRNLASAATSN